MVADFDWDEVSDWPREGVMRWWEQGWDWQSLQTKERPHPDYETYAEYYASTFRFPNPRDETKTITEEQYWGERWLTKFAGKKWDIYHLPTFDPKTGDKSPKHHAYEGDDKWSNEDCEAFALGLKARMRAGQRGDRRAPLSGIVTPQETNLGLSEKPVHVVFSGALFGKWANFSSALFGDWADFTSAQFGAFADFSSAQFGNNAHFTAAQFGDGANFSSARFGDGAVFAKAQFGDEADFTAAQFGDFADLSGAQFGDEADFTAAQFGDRAYLSGAQFGDKADLSGAQFSDRTSFENARFLGRVDFSLGAGSEDGQRSGRIAPDAPTDKAPPAYTLQMDKQQDWVAERAFREIYFNGTAFWGDADFTNRRFAEPADFTDAKFYGAAIFHNASLHEGTKFTTTGQTFFPGPGDKPQIDPYVDKAKREQQQAALKRWNENRQKLDAKRDEAKKTKPKETDKWTLRCIEFEAAYRRLKILMQAMGARNEEQFFYTLEIKSRMQRLDVPKAEKFAAGLYEWVSDYGQSILRPLLWALFGWPLIVFLLLFALTIFGQPGIVAGDALNHCGHFVVRNLIPGFSLREMLQGCHDEVCYQLRYQEWIDGFISAWWGVRSLFYLIATLYSAVSLALWFLFALALRRRFQIS